VILLKNDEVIDFLTESHFAWQLDVEHFR